MAKSDTTVVGIRMTQEAKRKLEEVARRNYRTLSDQLRLIVDSWLIADNAPELRQSTLTPAD